MKDAGEPNTRFYQKSIATTPNAELPNLMVVAGGNGAETIMIEQMLKK